MAIDNKIIDEIRQYNINGEVEKISALSAGKTDNYGYLSGKATLPSDQSWVIEQAKFPYSPLRKALGKQTEIQTDV